MKEKPWLTIEEAQTRVHRSKRTIYRWAKEGRVRTWRPIVTKLYNLDDLIAAEKDTQGQGVR